MAALETAPHLPPFGSRLARLLRSQGFFVLAVQLIVATAIVVPGFYAVYYSQMFRDVFFDVRFSFIREGTPDEKVLTFLGNPTRVELGNKLMSLSDANTTNCMTYFYQTDTYTYNKILVQDGKVIQKAQNEYW